MRQRGINVSSFAHRNQRAAASELEVWRRQCPKLAGWCRSAQAAKWALSDPKPAFGPLHSGRRTSSEQPFAITSRCAGAARAKRP
jgi:hypothetical protein